MPRQTSNATFATVAARRLLTGASVFAIAATMSTGASAQGQTASVAGLEEIVVSARRVDENLQTAPISVTALSGDLLKSLNIVRVQELSLVTPNLVVRDSVSNGTGSLVYMRGIGAISVQTLSDPPINIYVDGVVRSRPTGNAFDLPDIERIEVLRGPQGTLFGRNTTGGAIAVYTKRATEDFGGSFEIGYGHFNEFSAQAVMNTGDLGDSGVRTKFTLQHRAADGYVRTINRGRSGWGGYVNNTSGSFTLSADPTDNLSIDNRIYFEKMNTMTAYQLLFATGNTLNAYNLSPTLGGPPVVLSPQPLDLYHYDPRRRYDPYAASWGNTLNIAYDVNENLQIKSITGLSGLVQKQTGQLGGSYLVGQVTTAGVTRVEGIETFTPNNSSRQIQFSQEFQANGSFGDVSYTAGLYYFMENNYEHLNTVTPAFLATGFVNKTDLTQIFTPETRSYAGYANVSYRPASLDDKLEISGGLRYTDEKKSVSRIRETRGNIIATPIIVPREFLSTSWDDLGWNASVSYKWTPDIMTFARGSSAFRSGAYTSVNGTPVVNPEEATSFEAGFKSEWFDNRVRINGAFFKTWYDDLQVNQRNAATSVSVVVNAGKATFTGFDLEATALLGNGLQMNASVGHVDPKYTAYNFIAGAGSTSPVGSIVNVAQFGRFPIVSRWTYNIGGQYTSEPTSVGVFGVRVDYTYQSGYVFQPITTIPAGVVQAATFIASPNNETFTSGESKNLRVSLTLSEIPTGTDTLQNVKVQIYSDNLTNHRYRLSVVDFGTYVSAVFNRPRSYGLRVSADF